MGSAYPGREGPNEYGQFQGVPEAAFVLFTSLFKEHPLQDGMRSQKNVQNKIQGKIFSQIITEKVFKELILSSKKMFICL